MTKKRVYDLAKEYGMKGQDLAAKLRDWGFSVKSHMSALEESDLLVIEGRLAANGYGSAAAAPKEEPSLGGLIVRKKKKKPAADDAPPAGSSEAGSTADADAPAEAAPAAPSQAAAEEAAPAAEAPAAESQAPAADAGREAPAGEAAHEKAADGTAAGGDGAAESATPAAPEPTASAPAEPQRAPAASETETPAPAASESAASEPAASESAAAQRDPAPASEPAAAPSEAAPEKTETPAEPARAKKKPAARGDDDAAIVRPNEQRRAGKVVGFIDLSKVQSSQPARRESRRLQSRDDGALSSVQPTMGRGRKPLGRGGDVARGNLTAAELREREGQRFLRRQRPQTGGRGGRGGRPGGGGRGGSRHSGPAASPYAGGTVSVESPVTVKKLGDALALKQNDVLKRAFDMLGFGAVNINSVLDEDTSVLLAGEFDVDLEITHEVAAEEALLTELKETRTSVVEEHLSVRPPTVAILGHVDHGKTTLIDTIRRSGIAEAESGGITQHIGAYQVETEAGHKITVVDTPGHAAFTAMRARGAKAVDIVIVVVAADDGVMPQTQEAINHAKAAGTPIVIALNKIDKHEANPEKVKQQLASIDLLPEDFGGQVAVMPVSALEGDGIDALLERVFLEGELLELRAHDEGAASGVVLEAEVQKGRGIVAHLLVQDGSLDKGQVILAGEGYGRVRSIHDDRGDEIETAGPSKPVEVTGLTKLPGIGEYFHVVPDLQRAKEVAEERERSNRMSTLAERRSVNSENILAAVKEQDRTQINLIVKGDVQGSVEVIKSQLDELTHDEIQVRVLHSGVGAVTESDVDLAVTSEALIVAFHVGTDTKARQAAERGNVTIKNYRVIYEMLDDVKALMEGSLTPDIVEDITGHAEIRVIFHSSKIGNIGGSHVIDGKIYHDGHVRLLRDSKVIFTGRMGSLRREKDAVKEVREGFDCGITIKGYNDIREGDVVECYKLKEVKRTL